MSNWPAIRGAFVAALAPLRWGVLALVHLGEWLVQTKVLLGAAAGAFALLAARAASRGENPAFAGAAAGVPNMVELHSYICLDSRVLGEQLTKYALKKWANS